MRSLSFRARLALTMSVLILVIAAAIFVYVPRKLEQEAMAVMTHKAETLASLTAFTIHPSVYFQDRAAVEEALSGARSDKDVSYIVVVDRQGQRLASFHPERASAPALARQVSGGAVSPDRTLYDLMLPIRDGKQELARLYIGLSLARLHQQIVRTRLAIGLLSVLILVGGLAAVVLVSNVMTRPLRDVADGARRIAAGDLTQRVASARDDEIGQLASSFNAMAASVAERDARLRDLSRRLLSVQEKERVRIAREVHDELGQALTALKIDVQHLSSGDDTADISRTIDGIVDLVRRIASDLRPAILDDLGVTAALEQQLRRLRETTGLETTLTVNEEPTLDLLTGVTLYRIAQEGLANIVRHAGATRVEIVLASHDEAVTIEIRDDGRGMSLERIGPQSLGLLGMRERAEMLGGTVNIHSTPGKGTVLTATLPLTSRNVKS